VTFTLTSPSHHATTTTGLTDYTDGIAYSGTLGVTALGTWTVVASIAADTCNQAATSSTLTFVAQNVGVPLSDDPTSALSGTPDASASHSLSTAAIVAVSVLPAAAAVLLAVYVWRRCVVSRRENAARAAAKAHSAAAHTTPRSKPNAMPNSRANPMANPMAVQPSAVEVRVTVDAATGTQFVPMPVTATVKAN